MAATAASSSGFCDGSTATTVSVITRPFRPRHTGADQAVYTVTATVPKNVKRVARFEREIDAMRQLNASGLAIVPTVLDAGVDPQGRPYYVMPWYEDGSLEEAIVDGRLEDTNAAVRILLQLVDALEVLHSSGWAHRDLKPANILLSGDQLVLCDLGLALPFGIDGEEARLTTSMEAIGSR